MSKKLLISIIVLAGFALAGIIYAQLYYIRVAINQNEFMFDQKVNDALLTFVEKLDQKKTIEIIHSQVKRNRQNPDRFKYFNPPPEANQPMVFEFNDSMVNKMVFISEMDNATVDLRLVDSNVVIKNGSRIQNRHTIQTIRKSDGTQIIHKSWTNADDTLIFIDENGFSTHLNYKLDTAGIYVVKKDKVKAKAEKFKGVIQKMEDESREHIMSLRSEIDKKLVDSLLVASFKQNDILLPYEYVIQQAPKIQKKGLSSPGFDSLINQKKYSIGLYPNDIIPKPDKLILYFPNRKEHLLKSMSILLPSSLVFSLIVIVAFSISIMMVIRQKKISDIKSDFINNMTHEFKTPIATISLAADSIVNPKVIDDKSKIEHFTRIIKEENKRMNLQVERILQMSLLDKSEMDLNLSLLNINEIIEKAIEKMAMQMSRYNAILSLSLCETNIYAQIDEIHFINVIHNLIDNALKYSDGIPEIKISTALVNHGIVISFEDKGIGLSKEAQSKVFEKFYRVSKGNIHNIKGFGLGLSYVKAIVEALGGRISVKSEVNKGSRFDIFIPQKQKENGKSV